jgi:hypothetical protein
MKEDTRRLCDGIRIHPYLGEVLAAAGNAFRENLRFRNDQFNRVAIPFLENAGLIVKIDPHQPLPAGLPQREKSS